MNLGEWIVIGLGPALIAFLVWFFFGRKQGGAAAVLAGAQVTQRGG